MDKTKITTNNIDNDKTADDTNGNDNINTLLNNTQLDEVATLGNFTTFLSLDEEKFAILSPVVLEQLEKSLLDSNIRRSLYISFLSSGGNVNDIRGFYSNLVEMTEKELGSELSQQKIDFLKVMIAMMSNSIENAATEAERIVTIPLEIINKDAKVPTYAHDTDAGLDVYALDDYTINPGETKVIPTGLKVAIPTGYELQVRPKSGRCLKTKLRVANTPGTIDSGYRGEIGIIIENVDPPIKDITYEFDETGKLIILSILHGSSYTIGKGEKFAQLVLSAVPKASFQLVDKLTEAGNRNGGFGSTGLK